MNGCWTRDVKGKKNPIITKFLTSNEKCLAFHSRGYLFTNLLKANKTCVYFCTLPIHFEEHRTFIIIEEDNKNMGRKGEVFVAAKFFHPL